MYYALGVLTVLLVVVFASGMFFRRRSLPCPVWLRWCVELDNPFAKTNRASFIVEHLALERGMAALDAGCGPGRVTIPLARQVGESGSVLALDIQEGMLARTRQKAQQAGLNNIRYLRAGLGQGQLGACQFDRAVLVTVLGEIPERSKAMEEIFNALKPGGLLSVTEIVMDPHFQRRARVVALAKSTGFRETAFWGNSLAYTMHLEKPMASATSESSR